MHRCGHKNDRAHAFPDDHADVPDGDQRRISDGAPHDVGVKPHTLGLAEVGGVHSQHMLHEVEICVVIGDVSDRHQQDVERVDRHDYGGSNRQGSPRKNSAGIVSGGGGVVFGHDSKRDAIALAIVGNTGLAAMACLEHFGHEGTVGRELGVELPPPSHTRPPAAPRDVGELEASVWSQMFSLPLADDSELADVYVGGHKNLVDDVNETIAGDDVGLNDLRVVDLYAIHRGDGDGASFNGGYLAILDVSGHHL